MARMIVAEACPECDSLEVRTVEPRWFAVGLDRRAELDQGWVERLEFACHECGLHWD
ncbi:hypothetical protein [Microbacterium sp. CPCC 204701]|uniref:hypothetical protein n=1 Tax=Microbacterium sp. CPCC 204701 TaxID=2493084 RepID=UPI0013E3CCCD|nr:hypothetical protein [Microbacterium sp. CPCC 204701]